MKRILTQPDFQALRGLAPSRTGSTLTEVLVSLLIMSIGIFGVMSLFPISIQRSIRATTLTQGTDLRYNAEAFLDMAKRMTADPDLDGVLGVPIQYTGPTGASYYIIDPVGWVAMNAENPPPASLNPDYPDFFGNTAGINPQIPPPPAPPFPLPRRYRFGRLSAPAAAALAMMPDSWAWQYEDLASNPATPNAIGTLANYGATQIDVNGLSASGFVMAPGVAYRAVIYSRDGLSSQVRLITQFGTPNPDTIMWTEDLNSSGALDAPEDPALPNGRGNGNGNLDHYPLPVTFTPERVLIESQDARYSWLMTVRLQASLTSADIDIVVFFNRPLNDMKNEEQTYVATFKKGAKDATIDYTVNGTAPHARRGSYVFDADNARWYRITNVSDNGSGQMTLQIEIPAYDFSPATGGRAMFPRGVVDVYPIGTKVQ